MKELKLGMGRKRENSDYIASCIQMTWFCVVSQKEDLRVKVGRFVEVYRREV